MKQSKKFTFKKQKATGRYRSFQIENTDIKQNGKVVGMIEGDSLFRIRLAVLKDEIGEDGNPNCKWKWVTLKDKSESEEQARLWLNEFRDVIREKFNLYEMED